MPYVNAEQISQAKSVDLITYLKKYRPQSLVKISRNTYSTVDHSSLKISADTGLWHWFTKRVGGKTALDYLIKVEGVPFTEAVLYINNLDLQSSALNTPQKKPPIKQKLTIPEPFMNNDRVRRYLINERKINREIVDYFLSTGQIYEEKEHHNVVFLGYDKIGEVKYVYMRGTGKQQFHAEADGSSKRYSFSFTAHIALENKSLHVFESAIDLLSYASLLKMNKQDWQKENYLSVGGVFSTSKDILPEALNQYLYDNLAINKVCLHFDNDSVGKEAAEKIKDRLNFAYEVVINIPCNAKDVNEQLKNEIQNNAYLAR